MGALIGSAIVFGIFYLIYKGATRYRENAEAPRKSVKCPRCNEVNTLEVPVCGNCYKPTRLKRVIGKPYVIAGDCKRCNVNIPVFPECRCGANLAGVFFNKTMLKR